jgi:hypothetical protein
VASGTVVVWAKTRVVAVAVSPMRQTKMVIPDFPVAVSQGQAQEFS